MTRRLFWKILIAFWVTFILIIEGVWVLLVLSDKQPKPAEPFISEQFSSMQIAAAQTALSYGGEPALKRLLDQWTARERQRLSVAKAPAEDIATSPGAISAQATAPDGHRFTLVYDPSASPSPPPRDLGPFDVPLPLVILGLAGGLVFSAGLAWYITAPIARLRAGFSTLAGGDLTTRLSKTMGQRRDEIADLARDFDAMADRLQILVNMRDQLLHDVSHELRSPLARLQLAIGLARQNPQRSDDVFERIELEVRRIDMMVDELLSLARAESAAAVQQGYFDLRGLMLDILQDARFEGSAAGISIKTTLDQAAELTEPTISGDVDMMRRALDNVLRNAIRHSPDGGTIEFDLVSNDKTRQFEISVADQGEGIRPEIAERMFEPFVRDVSAPDMPGFGLGLAIARRVVLSHGGTITAKNKPDGGLRMLITLPFGPPQAEI